ncbi:MAG: PAS domain-containing protein [Desulfatiglans sp.]|jgi:PAS domain S-box-containing protein|nr:PAS domain-containing protein [Thermodesulfobacteriota bacterium]MEE4354496.1 PAS domain-containing protein [Desulfatiglans sp.]
MTLSPPKINEDPSAEWFSDYIGNLPVGIFRMSIEGKIVYCNHTCARILGYDSENRLTGFSAFSLCHTKKEGDGFFRAILKKGFINDFVMGLNTRDGNSIFCSFTARGVFDNKGRMVFLDGVFKEIDQTMESGGKDAQLDTMADTLDDFVFLVNTEGVLLDVNKAGSRFLGLPKDKLLKESLSQFISSEYKDLFSFFLIDILETRQLDGVFTMMGKAGGEYHVDFYAILVKVKAAPPYIRIVGRDITEQTKQHRKHIKSAKLQGALEMAGGTAHRLNQPLTILNNLMGEVLSDRQVRDDLGRKLTKINRQIQNLNRIAGKIKSIKRYETMDYLGAIKIIDIDKASNRDDYKNGSTQVVGERA